MKLTTLADVLNCCKGEGGEEIELSEDMRVKAKHCLDQMLHYGG